MKRRDIKKWVSYKEIEEHPYEFGDLYSSGYREVNDYEYDNDESYREAIMRELILNNYTICGDTHQVQCIPVFEDNRYVLLSMRKWSELMVDAVEIRERENKYYPSTDFYMACLCKKEEKLPNEKREKEE